MIDTLSLPSLESEISSFPSVWDALNVTPATRENLRLRSQLMMRASVIIEQQQLTMPVVTRLAEWSETQCASFVQGKLMDFTLDDLVGLLTALNQRVTISVASISEQDGAAPSEVDTVSR